jgi:hypothetical protein
MRTERTRALRRAVAQRAGLCLLVVPVAFVLAAPDSTSIDFDFRHQSGFGNRLIALYRHCEAVAQGHFLTDETGGSFTRDANEVLGPNLAIADVALVRSWLGLPPATFNQVLRWQSHLAAFAAVVMLVAGAPLWTIGLYLLLLWLFPATPASLAGQRAWPQLIAVALAVCALASLSRWAARERPQWLPLAGLLGLALCAGLVGQFRDEARAHFLVPLLVLAVASAGVALLRPAAVRDSLARARREGLAGLSAELRIVLAVVVAALGVASVTLLRDLNLRVFEAIEDVEHRPERGWHLFWHPLYLGLGFDFHTRENLAWEDPIAVADAHAAHGSFVGFTSDYERSIRDRYLEIAYRNTPFFARVHLHKLRVALFGEGRQTTTLLLSLAVLLVFAATRELRRRPGDPVREACMLLGGVALAGITLAPGLMAGSDHLQVLDAGLLGAAFLAAATWLVRVPADEAAGGEPVYARRLGRVLRAGILAGLLLLSLVCWRVVRVESHRQELSAALASGDVEFADFFSEYHADASWAFNDLPRSARAAVARRLTAARSRPLDPGLRFASARGSSQVLAGIWTQRALFLLIRLDRGARGGSLPLEFEFRKPALVPTNTLDTLDFSPPHRRTSRLDSLPRKLHLPTPLDPGPWLFSIRAPRANLEAIEIDPARLRVSRP